MSGPVLGNNDNASLQSIDVGTASTKNVLPDFSLFRITSSLPPRTRSEIPGWLATLDKMDSAPNTGEIFVAAVNLRNNTENSQWFINPYGPAVESIAIHFYLNDKQVLTRTGLYHNDTVLLQQGAFIELPKGESGTLLLVYNSDFYFSKLKVRILDASQIDETLNSNTILTLFALGILLASGVYNLFFYYASRDSVYLYLTLCIVLLATGWCNLLGILQFPSPDIIRFTLIPPFLLSIACAIQFTRKFLDLNNISTKLDNGLSLLFWLCVLTTPITALTPAHGIYMTYTGSILMVMLSLTAATVALKRHYKPARFFIIAYSAFGLQAVIWFLLSLIPELQLNINLSLVGLVSTTLGVILLSLTLLAKVSHITQENNRLANNLELKVYERTEALAEANVALEHLICELQEASSAKSSFLANMSHEIRTPLTSIIGYADGILMGDISRDEQERVIRVISENGNHLLHIISDILDISKIEADKLEYEMLPTRITDIITQVESVIAKRAQDKELEFKLNYHFPIPSEVETDPYRFKQILLNLTNNAVKFTDCGEISIDVRYQNEQLFVRVKDSGIGMPAEKIAAIFEPFEQGDTSVARQFGGTGLGLSISKRLALDLGGDIHATSEVNKGSSFEVVIRAVPTENNEMLGASKDMWKMQEIKEENHIIPDFSGSKVLLVDDHPNNRDLIRIILDRMHVTVTEAEDGDIALQRMFEAEYDLILMDIQMPRMKGDEATEKLRQQGFDLPIIALTANNMKHEIESYLRKGFTGHLAKPIVRHDFIATLSQYLKSNGSTKRLFSNDEMLDLVTGYHADLPKQIDQVELVWAEQNVPEFIEATHRVKGAAGSFGFAALGDKFADMEKLAKDNKLEELHKSLPEVIHYGRLCCHIEGINIPKGIINFDMNVDFLLTEIQQFTQDVAEDLEMLTGCVGRGENNIALLYLNRITHKAKKLAWQDLHKMSLQLEKQIKTGSMENSANKEIAELIASEIARVNAIF